MSDTAPAPLQWPSASIQRYDGPDRARTIRYFYGLQIGIVTDTRLGSVNALGELVIGYRREAGSLEHPTTVAQAKAASQGDRFLSAYHTTSTLQRAPLHIATGQASQGAALREQAELATSLWLAMEQWRTIEAHLDSVRRDQAARLNRAETVRRQLLGSIFSDGVVIAGKPNPNAARARLLAAQRITSELSDTLARCRITNTKRLEHVASFLDWNNRHRAELLEVCAQPSSHSRNALLLELQRLLIAKYDVYATSFLNYWETQQATGTDWYKGADWAQVVRDAYLTEWAWEQFDGFLAVLDDHPEQITATSLSDLADMMPAYCTDPVHSTHYERVGWWVEQMLAAETPPQAQRLLRHVREAIRYRARSLPRGKKHPAVWLPQAEAWLPGRLASQLARELASTTSA